MPNIIRVARIFAENAHKKQVRKYNSEPYINHPVDVAILVNSVKHDNNMLAAALLHDVVEDTHYTISDISKEFGCDVADLVENLTDISVPLDGNRKVRKEIDRIHTSLSSNRAKTIKIADLIDNSKSILKHDLKFAIVYMAEKKALLNVLIGGDSLLLKIANSIVRKYYNHINNN